MMMMMMMKRSCYSTGERPFGCEICKSAFTQKNALQAHQMKHLGEKPHQCDFCHMAFTLKGNLTAHIRRAHQSVLQARSQKVHGSSSSSEQSFMLVDKELRHSDNSTAVSKLLDSSSPVKISDGATLMKLSDGSIIKSSVDDDLDLTAESNLVNFM